MKTSVRSAMAVKRLTASLCLVLALLLPATARAEVSVTIEITGVETALETNVRLYLSIEQQKDSELLTPGLLRRLHRRADEEIRAALEPFGYYRPQIESSLTDEGDNRWRALYRIDPGSPVVIEGFEFTLDGDARTDAEFAQHIQSSGLETGKAFSHLDYENFKSGLGRLAAERGYFDAGFRRHRIEIDREANAARVYLEFASGPRYLFGELRLNQDTLDDELLRRYTTFDRGDPYDLDVLLDFQQALNDSLYFETVEVAPGKTIEGELEVPVEVRLTPRSRHHFRIGAGYGTDTGARGRFGWQMPRINSRGHHLDSGLNLSEIGYKIYANYQVPVLNPRTDQIVYSVSEEEEEFETGPSTKRSLGVSFQHGRGEWRETLSLEYQREDFTIDELEQTSNLLLPGVSWSRIWGSEFINVLDGIRLDLTLRGSSEELVSDTEFFQYGVQLKFITSLGPRDRIIMRGAAGEIDTDDFEQIPTSVRYFAGGASSVRGYAYQSLGPADNDGDAIGAQRLLVGSVEYEHYFNDRWGLALFADAGNALEDFSDDLEQGVGFGLRWKSPIGPVRIDLANTISDNEDWRLHINIGPDL